jgi:GDP-L-fucose synthase
MADACVYLMQKSGFKGMVNIGVGDDITIRQLAELVGEVIGFTGELEFDLSKPDGTPQKLLNVEQLNTLGWQAKTPIELGIQRTYRWFLANIDHLRL